MHSCLYRGQVKHRRYTPTPHAFSYGLFMFYLDLDEIPALFDKFWLWSASHAAVARFKREDHLGDTAMKLSDAVRNLVKDKTGIKSIGPIRLLTNLSYFGYGFNPVSFYYCYDAKDENIEVIIAEVNNTPWGEQHCYVLPQSSNKGSKNNKRFLLNKCFHVSPFMDMNIAYDWRFTQPDKNLIIHMKNYQNDQAIFDATLTLASQPINSRSLATVLIRYPVITVKIILAIYFQALRLWLKKVPYYPHPNKQQSVQSVGEP